MLSKVEIPGSPNGPSMMDRWWSVLLLGGPYMMRSEMKMKQQYRVIYFQPVTKRHETDISNSPIAWKFDRWLGSKAARPRLFESTCLEY